MTAPAHGLTRVLRVGVLGGSSLVLAAAAHLVGGGALPTPGLLVVTGLLLGLVSLTVTARRCRFPALLVLLAAEQLVLHLVFSAAAGVGATCTALTDVGHHAQMLTGASCPPMPGMTDSMSMPGWGMWVAHGVAVLATAWLLARGESWLWRATERIVRGAAAAPSHPIAVAELVSATSVPPTITSFEVREPAAPRGPPVLSTR